MSMTTEHSSSTEHGDVEHEMRGHLMSGAEMGSAANRVEDFIASDEAAALFTDSERLYADIALQLVAERAKLLQSQGRRGSMGRAFTDAYSHISGVMQEERAQDPHNPELTALSNAYEAGEVAGAKLDALLAAARQGRSMKSAVAYIASDEFAAQYPPVKHGRDIFKGMTEAEMKRLADEALRDIFDE